MIENKALKEFSFFRLVIGSMLFGFIIIIQNRLELSCISSKPYFQQPATFFIYLAALSGLYVFCIALIMQLAMFIFALQKTTINTRLIPIFAAGIFVLFVSICFPTSFDKLVKAGCKSPNTYETN